MLAAVTIDLTDVQTLVGGLAALVVAWGVLWRKLIRPASVRFRAVADIVQRELTPNGGNSIKDRSMQAAKAIAAATDAAEQASESVSAIARQVADVQVSQETICQLLDNVERDDRLRAADIADVRKRAH